MMKDDYDLSPLRTKPKRKNSRTKGNAFERHIAKLFNNRFKTTEFSRSPGSGAFATTHQLPEHLKIYGDLITPQKFKYCIECKKGYLKVILSSIKNNITGTINPMPKTSKQVLIKIKMYNITLFFFSSFGKLFHT